MKTKTDHKAGYSNTRLESPTITIEPMVLPAISTRIEGFDERPFFKTGHTVAAILE